MFAALRTKWRKDVDDSRLQPKAAAKADRLRTRESEREGEKERASEAKVCLN